MITKIHAKSRAGDVSTTATSMLNDFANRDFSTDSYMTTQIGKLHSNNKLMMEALKENVAFSILSPIDEKRDDLLRVIFHEVNAKELWPDAAISQAASVIAAELDKYGFEIINIGYTAESANINALLQDLKKPEVRAAIAKLRDLKYLIAKLEAAQEEFEAAYLQFVGINIEKGKLKSATKLRNVLRNQINNELIVYLNGMAMSKPDTYKDCAEVVAGVIAANNSTVRNRLKKPGEDPSTE